MFRGIFNSGEEGKCEFIEIGECFFMRSVVCVQNEKEPEHAPRVLDRSTSDVNKKFLPGAQLIPYSVDLKEYCVWSVTFAS